MDLCCASWVWLLSMDPWQPAIHISRNNYKGSSHVTAKRSRDAVWKAFAQGDWEASTEGGVEGAAGEE